MSKGSKPGGKVRSRLSRRERSELVERLRRDGALIADEFGLEYKSIEAEDARVKRRYGSCHGDGRIKIRLNHVRTGKPLKYSSMIDTLCHELAHLRYFDHSQRFRAFYQQILEWARRAGIYRPAPRKEPQMDPAAAAAAPAGFAAVLAAISDPGSVESGGLVHAADPVPTSEPAEGAKQGPPPPRKRSRPRKKRTPLREYEQLWLFGQ